MSRVLTDSLTYMPKPNASKNIQFSKQKLFVLEKLLLSFGKILDYPPRRIAGYFSETVMGPPPRKTVGQLSKEILRKFFLEIPFTNIFVLVSFHVMHSHLIF